MLLPNAILNTQVCRLCNPLSSQNMFHSFALYQCLGSVGPGCNTVTLNTTH